MTSRCLHIVIVNWNSGNLLRECVASIAEYGAQHVDQLVIVDNGSTDGSDQIEAPDLPLRLIRTGANLGFAAASNIGAAEATAPYVLLLNPDTRLENDCFAPALAFMESEAAARIGVCGIQLRDETGAVQRHSSRFPTWRTFIGHSFGLSSIWPRLFPPMLLQEFDHVTSRPLDHVIGAFFLVRRPLWQRLGGLDERFFVYLEDLDFSYRAAAEGWGNYFLAETSAFHKGGGTSQQVKAHRLFYSLRSRILYAFKHFSHAAAWTVAITTLLVEPMTRVVQALMRRSSEECQATLKGYAMLYGDLLNLARTHRRQARRK